MSVYVMQWKDLANDEGSVHFICTWFDVTATKPAIAHGKAEAPTAVLSVFVDKATNLQVISGFTNLFWLDMYIDTQLKFNICYNKV